jgi:hypothetical protein
MALSAQRKALMALPARVPPAKSPERQVPPLARAQPDKARLDRALQVQPVPAQERQVAPALTRAPAVLVAVARVVAPPPEVVVPRAVGRQPQQFPPTGCNSLL